MCLGRKELAVESQVGTIGRSSGSAHRMSSYFHEDRGSGLTGNVLSLNSKRPCWRSEPFPVLSPMMPQYGQSTEGLNKDFLALPSQGEIYGSSQGLHNSCAWTLISNAPVPVCVGNLQGCMYDQRVW
jgi:hypothetical protein